MQPPRAKRYARPAARHDDRERARDADGSVGVVEPLAVRVRIAAAAAGADRDRRNALTDRHVRVGRREREIGATSDEARCRDRRLNERVLGRRLAARARPDRFDDTTSARVPKRALGVLVVGRGSARRDESRARTSRAALSTSSEGRSRARPSRESSSRRARRRYGRRRASCAVTSAEVARRVVRRRRRRHARRSATPNAAHEWPPGPVNATRKRREPSARWMIRSSPAPSRAIVGVRVASAPGEVVLRAAQIADPFLARGRDEFDRMLRDAVARRRSRRRARA